jgi:hypothetical protein
VKRHGVVLVSARGPVPNLAQAIAGAPIRGSWWGHPKSHQIFRVINAVLERRLPKRALAAIREEHTARPSPGRENTVSEAKRCGRGVTPRCGAIFEGIE